MIEYILKQTLNRVCDIDEGDFMTEKEKLEEKASEYVAQSNRYKRIMIIGYVIALACFAWWIFSFIALGSFNPVFMIPSSFSFIAFCVIGALARQKHIKYMAEAKRLSASDGVEYSKDVQ